MLVWFALCSRNSVPSVHQRAYTATQYTAWVLSLELEIYLSCTFHCRICWQRTGNPWNNIGTHTHTTVCHDKRETLYHTDHDSNFESVTYGALNVKYSPRPLKSMNSSECLVYHRDVVTIVGLR